MKFLIIFSLLIVFFSCKKEVPYVEPDWEAIYDSRYIGKASLQLNNDTNKLKFYPLAGIHPTDNTIISLGFSFYNKNLRKFQLNFYVNKIIGERRVFKLFYNGLPQKDKGVFHLLDHDATCNTFDVNEADSTNNWFALDTYNPVTKDISGRFSLSTIRPANSSAPCGANTPYEYNIRNGVFNTVVQ